MVLDVSDEIIGYVDLGKGTFKDKSGSHFATIQSDGTILDRDECKRGSLQNFTYHKLKMLASYFFFFDGKLINDKLKTVLTSEGADAPVAAPAATTNAPAQRAAVSNTTPSSSNVDSSSIASFVPEDGDSISKEEARLLRHVKGAKATAPAAAKPAPSQAQAKPAAPVAPTAAPIYEPPAHKKDESETLDERGLVSDSDAKARREAERMSKMMGGMSVSSTAAASSSHKSQHDVMAEQYPVPARPEIKSKYEVELWTEINRARTSPKELIARLEATRSHYEGTTYRFPGTHTTRLTREGVAGVDIAITFLKSQSAISPIALSEGLSKSSKDFVSIAATSKQIDALENDEQGSARFNRYGKWSGKLFQNIALGNLSPSDVVLSWIIDDGNPNRDHRASIFNQDVNFVGVSSGPHIEFGRATVACFVSKYIEGAASTTAAVSTAASHTAAPTSGASGEDDIPTVSAESEYKVGPLTDAGDKYFLDFSNLGCPVNGLKVEVLDNGKSLAVTRTIRVSGQVKESRQRMKLPFQLVAAQVRPVFSASTGILTLNMAKPSSGGAKTQAFKIGSFTIPAWSQNTNDKVSVQANATSESYVFVCEPSKHLTDVSVSIDAEKKLTFDMQYTFDTVVEGQPATKTVKMASQFGLPFEVFPDQVSVQPNGEKGSKVTILKAAPSGGTINQPDVVVPIQSQ